MSPTLLMDMCTTLSEFYMIIVLVTIERRAYVFIEFDVECIHQINQRCMPSATTHSNLFLDQAQLYCQMLLYLRRAEQDTLVPDSCSTRTRLSLNTKLAMT